MFVYLQLLYPYPFDYLLFAKLSLSVARLSPIGAAQSFIISPNISEGILPTTVSGTHFSFHIPFHFIISIIIYLVFKIFLALAIIPFFLGLGSNVSAISEKVSSTFFSFIFTFSILGSDISSCTLVTWAFLNFLLSINCFNLFIIKVLISKLFEYIFIVFIVFE